MATNPNSNIHMHFRTTNGKKFVGHLDDEIMLMPGSILYIPLNKKE